MNQQTKPNKFDASIIEARGEGLVKSLIGSDAEFIVYAKNKSIPLKDLQTKLIVTLKQSARDGGGEIKCRVEQQEDEQELKFIYTPTQKDAGTYDLTISFEGKPISGSPFHPIITGAAKSIDPTSIGAKGEGLTKAVQEHEAAFSIFAEKISPQDLAAHISVAFEESRQRD